MPLPETFSDLLRHYFPFPPTAEQLALFEQLSIFINQPCEAKNAFILTGYAGTGKTTAIRALTKALKRKGLKSVLLAPTGRAAKVIAQYTGRKAYTLHRQIYKQTLHPFSGSIQFELQKNYQEHTIFIIDEASMISYEHDSGNESQLTDLVQYVFQHTSNKIVFIGDTAQLPPVGQPLSYALNSHFLHKTYGLHVLRHQLTEVVRHQQQSGILENATRLRQQLQSKAQNISIHTQPFKDTYRMSAEKTTEGLSYAYLKYGIKNTLIICPSNQEATRYNQHVRHDILHRHSEVEAGDLMMVVRNNYRALPKSSSVGFLANGEFAEVVEVMQTETLHGFRFVNMLLRLPDYPKQKIFESKVLLDVLHSPQPAMTAADNKRLYEVIAHDYQHIPQKSRQLKAIRKDPYLNALHVKFAYALTCHKAQGGQWEALFVHPGHLGITALTEEHIRWLYTAFTRATRELFLIDFYKNPFL